MAALQQHMAECSAAQARMRTAEGAFNSPAEELLEAGYAPSGPQRAEPAELGPGSVSLAWGRRSGPGGTSAPAPVEHAPVGGSWRDDGVGTISMDEMDGLAEPAGAVESARGEASAEQADLHALEQQQEEQLAVLRRRAHAEAARREHHCTVCGKTFMLTPTEILRHRQSHAG